MASFSDMAASLMENLNNTDPMTWGPTTVPDKFKDMPYQPFSKNDRVGRVSISLLTTRDTTSFASQYSLPHKY